MARPTCASCAHTHEAHQHHAVNARTRTHCSAVDCSCAAYTRPFLADALRALRTPAGAPR
jgi:hypothetical protein